MTYCNGICSRFAFKKLSGKSWYKSGAKRCNLCKKFLDVKGKYCPCCKTQLRTNGRGSDVKKIRNIVRI